MRTTLDFYSIPDLYDILHHPHTRDDVRQLLRIARRFAPRSPGATWLEPACGSARHLRLLAKRSIRTIGFDIEPAMIRFARKAIRTELPDIDPRVRPHLFVGDMRTFANAKRIPPIAFAFNLINTIRHLASDAAMRLHFAQIANVLAPGGVYAVGISLAAYGVEPPTEDSWQGRRAGITVAQVVQYIPPTGAKGEAARAERVISHLTITRRGEAAHHIDSSYALRSYDLRQWRALIASSSLRELAILDSDGADIVAAEPGYFVFVLGKA